MIQTVNYYLSPQPLLLAASYCHIGLHLRYFKGLRAASAAALLLGVWKWTSTTRPSATYCCYMPLALGRCSIKLLFQFVWQNPNDYEIEEVYSGNKGTLQWNHILIINDCYKSLAISHS